MKHSSLEMPTKLFVFGCWLWLALSTPINCDDNSTDDYSTDDYVADDYSTDDYATYDYSTNGYSIDDNSTDDIINTTTFSTSTTPTPVPVTLSNTTVNLRLVFESIPTAAAAEWWLLPLLSDEIWPKTLWGFAIEFVNGATKFVALCNTKHDIKTVIGQLNSIFNNSGTLGKGFLNLSSFAALPSRANVTVMVEVMADNGRWYAMAEERAKNLHNDGGSDVVVILTSYDDEQPGFRYYVKSAWKNDQPKSATVSNSTVNETSLGLWRDVMAKINDLLLLCSFQTFVDDSRCYFVGDMFPYLYSGCLMFPELMSCVKYIFTVNATVDDPAYAKYCPGNFSKLPCDEIECTKTCERVTVWTECDGMCGGYKGFQYALDNYKPPYECCVLPANYSRRPCINTNACSSAENATMLPDELEFRLRMAGEKVSRGIVFICAAIVLTLAAVCSLLLYMLVVRRRRAKSAESVASDHLNKVIGASTAKIARSILKKASTKTQCPTGKKQQRSSGTLECKSIISIGIMKSNSSGSRSALTARSTSTRNSQSGSTLLQVKEQQKISTKKSV